MVAEILKEEPQKLAELRQKFDQKKTAHFSDGYLLRWLRANDGIVDKTGTALEKHFVFRDAWDLDALLEWSPPEVLQKYYPYAYPWKDRNGVPVLFFSFGGMDVEGLMRSCKVSDYIRIAMRTVEEGLASCNRMSMERNVPYEQMLFVIDLKDIAPGTYTFKPFTNCYVSMLTCFQENYPMVFKRILVLRAPSMAQFAFELLQPFLAENTRQLVQFLEEPEYKAALAHYVDPCELPDELGGLESKLQEIIPRHGPVPTHYYYVAEDDKVEPFQLTVYAGNKSVLEFNITNPGQRICWWYKTNNEDIGFAIYYVGNGDKLETVFPNICLECALVPETGQLECEKVGKYIVEFDNTYSWFTAKELSYKIEVIQL